MYLKDKLKNRYIAMFLLGVILVQSLGIFSAIGKSLTAMMIGPVSLFSIILVVSSAWILIGLWRKHIGV